LFKIFHPRINLTKLKTYLLNKITRFSDHKNRTLRPKQQNLSQVATLIWNLNFKNSEYARHKVGQMMPKFQLSRTYGLGLGCRCRRGTNFCPLRRRRRVTDGKICIAFFKFYDYLSVQTMFWVIIFFKNFGMKPIFSLLYLRTVKVIFREA
jgi:hypothetical protein